MRGNWLSWRVMLLPQLDCNPMYINITFSEWAHAGCPAKIFNTPATVTQDCGSVVTVLRCPGDRRPVCRLKRPGVGANHASMYAGGQWITSSENASNPTIQQLVGTGCPQDGWGGEGGGLKFIGGP